MRPALAAGLYALLLLTASGGVLRAQADAEEDEDYPPGLAAVYSSGSAKLERVDPDIAFAWEEASPDPRLPSGPFRAEWIGRLLVRSAGAHAFHVFLQGNVEVELAGKQVLSGRRDEAGWVSGDPVELPFGEHPLVVRFEKSTAAARVHLYWSSDEFPLEPVPSHLLFRHEAAPELHRIEQGRRMFEAHRCAGCHVDETAPLLAAPALTTFGAETDEQWLIAKVLEPTAGAPHAKMPHFGFTREEARAVAAFLRQGSAKVEFDQPARPKEPEKEQAEGEILLRSLGCLACHTLGELGIHGPYGGGDLAEIGRKRSHAWLLTWLRDPGRLNPDHRMPVFKLSDKERQQLALALSQLGVADAPASRLPVVKADAALLEEGRRLVDAARCAACHRIPGIESKPVAVKPLDAQTDWANSCLAAAADRKTSRPAYPQTNREAIVAYVKSRRSTSPEGASVRGERLLERKNCTACHNRELTKGIAGIAATVADSHPALLGASQRLIPPPLTAVGDRLIDSALAESITGEQKPRLPWLRVRMPRYVHTPEEKESLLAHLIGHDRIPDGAPHTILPETQKQPEAQRVLAGRELVGGKGLNCVACHQLGDYEPPNVALGTRGSDLHLIGARMRPEYFFRWTRSPLRIVPGVEMPSYVQPLAGVLDGTIETQLAAIWEALNDPQFTAPVNPSVVEQFWTVDAGQPARIARDVFSLPKNEGGGAVARAFAVGLENGHSLLFDLDRFTLRQWTFGDFAQQRTIGKSWYWNMAGVPLVTGIGREFDLSLRRSSDDSTSAPHMQHGSAGRVVNYRPYNLGVQLNYEIDFPVDGSLKRVKVSETIQPIDGAGETGRSGFERSLEFSDVPAGYAMVLRHPQPQSTFGSPRIESAQEGGAEGQEEKPFLAAEPVRDSAATRIRLRYTAALAREPVELPPPVEIPVAGGRVTTLPGFDGVRLPLEKLIMPTALGWTSDGVLAFTSLKGHVYLAHDTDGDGIEDRLVLFEEGLSAPFGIIADGDSLLVAHKPELLRLRDTDGDGRADVREVVASGWGYTDNYHDWTCGIVRDSEGNVYVTLGSDYAQPERTPETGRWRGKVLRIAPDGEVVPVGHAFRYPVGIAINADGEIFLSDQQGVQNTFNEINHLLPGRHYGVPSRHEEVADAPAEPPSVQIPHPWTRSVNGICFVPADAPASWLSLLSGQGLGAEYDSKFLMRFSLQKVGETYQGAAYPFSLPTAGPVPENFVGPICIAPAPDGSLYVGNIHDSGWQGGLNTGEIVRLTPNSRPPNGIREIRATRTGFDIRFFGLIDSKAALRPENYTLSGYTRVWEGSYATPDSGRHKPVIKRVFLSADGHAVALEADGLREGHVYEISCGEIGAGGKEIWPNVASYTLNRIP